MILGLSVAAFTQLHTIISLIGIATGRVAIEETLAKVEFFISMKNYLAAINILYKSLEIYPTEAQLYYRLGMLYAQFEQDFERAQQLLENAVRLDPVERRYHMALEYLDTLMLKSE